MSKALRDKGGNLLVIAELDSSNAPLTSYTNGTNLLNCGLLAESGVNIAANVQKFKAEDGKTYGQDEEYEGNTTGVLMETSKLIVDYISFGVRDKIHLEIKYEGIKNGKHQEVFKVVDVTPQMSFKTPGGTTAMKYDSTAIVNAADVVISSGALAIIAAAAGVTLKATTATIPAGREHVIVETNV